ncbi:MAG TPA: MBL fold metallo-hydrolase [Longimicrobiaceae bacterium]
MPSDGGSTGSHHGPDGRFRNPWPDSGTHGLRDVARMLWEQRRGERAPTPARGSFPTAEPTIVRPRADRAIATATWMGHSTVLLQVGGLNVLTDPVWSERASPVQWAGPRRVMAPPVPLEQLPPLDVVLLSHSHYDHLDKPTVQRLARAHPEATWVAPLKLGAYLRGFGVRDVVELDWWQSATVKGATVTATPARHFSARRAGDRNATLWCGFAMEVAGRRAWFAGDTASHPEFRRIGERCGPFDLMLMPIGAYEPRWFMRIVHVNAEEAVAAYVEAASGWPAAPAPQMLALHWGTFRLTSEPMDEPPRRAGVEWARRGLDPELLWVAAFGETRGW